MVLVVGKTKVLFTARRGALSCHRAADEDTERGLHCLTWDWEYSPETTVHHSIEATWGLKWATLIPPSWF